LLILVILVMPCHACSNLIEANVSTI
jgi:hypothetical protein